MDTRQVLALSAIVGIRVGVRCVRISRIYLIPTFYIPSSNFLACIVSEISAFIRTYGQTDTAQSTRLVILITKIYTSMSSDPDSWIGNASFCLLILFDESRYPFTLQVTTASLLPTTNGTISNVNWTYTTNRRTKCTSGRTQLDKFILEYASAKTYYTCVVNRITKIQAILDWSQCHQITQLIY